MLNGTSVMTGIAANCVYDAQLLLALAMGTHALAIQGLSGTNQSFHPFIHSLKPHPGQRWAASIGAVEDMRRSWSAYTIESERGDALATAVDFSEQTRDLYQQQFDVAQRTLLDVLDAENELFVARGQKISADINRQAAGYRILATVGSLLGNLGVAAPKASDGRSKSFRESMFD